MILFRNLKLLGISMKDATNVHSALYARIRELNFCGTDFDPDVSELAWELVKTKHKGGTIILPSNNDKGFDIQTYAASTADIKKNDGVTVDDLWDCTKEHYGLIATTSIFSTAAIPIKKITLGYKVYPGASPYTNISSHIGLKFFPRTNLRTGSVAANAAKATFGTIRVFRIVGRALPFAAVGLAVFDVISIGQCVYEKNK